MNNHYHEKFNKWINALKRKTKQNETKVIFSKEDKPVCPSCGERCIQLEWFPIARDFTAIHKVERVAKSKLLTIEMVFGCNPNGKFPKE